MLTLVATWTEDDVVHESILADGDEAATLFDQLTVRLVAAPSMVEVAMDGSGCALAIGAGRPETVVTYQSSLDPPYFISAGQPDRAGEIRFLYAGETTPYSAANAISVSDGRRALIEYVRDGGLPEGIEWERL